VDRWKSVPYIQILSAGFLCCMEVVSQNTEIKSRTGEHNLTAY